MRDQTTDSLLSEGVRRFNQGRVGDSIEAFSAAISRDPENAKAYYFRSFAYKTSGEPSRALQDIVRMLDLQMVSAESRTQAANLLKDMGLDHEALAGYREAVALDPRSPGSYAGKAELEMALGLRQRARRSLDMAFALAPRSAPILLKAAGILKDYGDCDAAWRRCREAVRVAPGSVLAHVMLAEIEQTLGLWDRVQPSLQRARALKPRSVFLLLRIADLFEEAEDFASALKVLRRAARWEPDSVPVLTRLARLEAWHGRASQTAFWGGKLLKLDPEHRQARRLLGAAHMLRGRWGAAVRELNQAVRADRGDAEAFIWRAEAYRRLGRFDEAFEDIARSRALWPSSMGALLNEELLRLETGRPLLIEDHSYILSRVPKEIAPLRERFSWEKPAPCAPLLERILERMRGNRSISTTFWARGKLVRHIHYFPRDPLVALQATVRFGDAGRVLRQFSRLLRDTPKEAYIFSHRAEVYLWTGRYRDAHRDFRSASALNSRLLWPKVGLAAVHLLTGEYGRALELLDYAAKNGGSDSILLIWRGELLRKLGRPREALEELRKWKEALPFRPPVWLNKALALLDVGDAAQARAIVIELKRRLPGFMADAAKASGASGAGDAALRRLLETALASMRGNRSSWMYTYYDRQGCIRVIRMRGVDPASVPAGLQGYFNAFYRDDGQSRT